MTMDEFDSLYAEEEKLIEYMDKQCSEKFKFRSCDNFPTIQDLEENDIAGNLEKYIGFLIFYSDCYTPIPEDEKEFLKVRSYIKKLLYDHLVIEEG